MTLDGSNEREKKAQNFPPYCLSIAKPKAQSVWLERRSNPFGSKWALETFQGSLCKLGMKPNMHLVEISTFSLHHIKLAKNMNIFANSFFSVFF